MPALLLAAQTAAAASSQIIVASGQTTPVSISAGGLSGAETATLQYHDGTIWRDYHLAGSATPEQITEFNSMVTLVGPGRWRVNKSITVAAVAVNAHSYQNP